MRWHAALLPLLLLLASPGCARPNLGSHGRVEHAAVLTEGEKVLEAERDAAFRDPPGGRNVTAEFRELFGRPEALTPERLARLRSCRVLLVHGLLGEVGLGVRRALDGLDEDQTWLDYFKDQEAVFRKQEIPFAHAAFRSHRVDRGGGKIAEAILRSDRPVILFSHSKGCVDALDALLKLQAQGQLDRVVGWIAVQGVFAGSPQADRFVENPGLRAVGIATMRIMGGNFDAVRDLTPAARAQYHAAHAVEIRALVARIPVLCFASWQPPKEQDRERTPDNTPPPLTSAFRIQPESSILEGCEYVAKSGVSHDATVIRALEPFDRAAFTTALLAMLAERLGGGTPQSPALLRSEPERDPGP
jgi:hypothetical protein